MSQSGQSSRERPLTDKVRSSLVLKLNLRMAWALLAGFVAMDLLLGLLLAGMALWRVEAGAQRLLQENSIPWVVGKKEKTAQVLDYSLRTDAVPGPEAAGGPEENIPGLVIPNFLTGFWPLGDRGVYRRIATPGLLAPVSLPERLAQTHYHLSLYHRDAGISIVYPLGAEAGSILRLLAALLVLQLCYVVASLGKNTRRLRRTLRPLADLAHAARDLQQSVSSLQAGEGAGSLQHLAGALSHIDAGQLDRRIAVDETQQELQALAQAINAMLSRIQESYQGQIRFVSDASHELRTPISVIQGYARLLNRWGKDDAQVAQEAIDAIQSEAEGMQSLVEQLLFLARGDSDTMPLHPEAFALGELAEEVMRDARLIDSQHPFRADLAAEVVITADRQLLKQALRILLDNSIKYTPPGEEISLKVSAASGQAIIQVQDNGIGIPPADVPYIFDRFYRSDESRTRQTGGVGLGLAIAQWIIRRHQGQLEVLSRPNIGTRTTITLPR